MIKEKIPDLGDMIISLRELGAEPKLVELVVDKDILDQRTGR